jgi:hypothetical protein
MRTLTGFCLVEFVSLEITGFATLVSVSFMISLQISWSVENLLPITHVFSVEQLIESS